MDKAATSLSFLNNLIEYDDNTSLSSKNHFNEFENDLDFINGSISNEPVSTTELHNDNAIETGPLIEKQPTKKKVSFDLPDVVEYESDFESENEEGNSDDSMKADSATEEAASEATSDLKQNEHYNDIKKSKLSQENIKCCEKCKCRIATVSIFEIPQLNSLFSNIKVHRPKKIKPIKKEQNRNEEAQKTLPKVHCSNSKQHLRKQRLLKDIPKRKSQGLNSLSNMKNEPELMNFEENDVKLQSRTPVNNSWANCTNGSLMSWLKTKRKQMRQKKLEEKRLKKEERRSRKIEEIDQMCRKQLSDKKVKDWMKLKNREVRDVKKKMGTKIIPTFDNKSSSSTDVPPNGYLVLNTFSPEADSKDKEFEKNRIKETKEKRKDRKYIVKPRKKVPVEETQTKCSAEMERNRNNPRITYDDWLRKKRTLTKKQKINEAKNDADNDLDNRIVVDERRRRLKEKQDLKRRTTSVIQDTRKGDNNQPKEDLKEDEKILMVASIDFEVRPEPQGCDDAHLKEDSIEALNNKIKQNSTKNQKEKSDGGDDNAFAFLLSDSKRAWMTGCETKQTCKSTQHSDSVTGQK